MPLRYFQLQLSVLWHNVEEVNNDDNDQPHKKIVMS